MEAGLCSSSGAPASAVCPEFDTEAIHPGYFALVLIFKKYCIKIRFAWPTGSLLRADVLHFAPQADADAERREPGTALGSGVDWNAPLWERLWSPLGAAGRGQGRQERKTRVPELLLMFPRSRGAGAGGGGQAHGESESGRWEGKQGAGMKGENSSLRNSKKRSFP